MAQKPQILLLEDEPDTAGAVAEYLTRKGFDVHVAFDGNRALSLVSRYGASLSAAVLDIMVPGVDGYELCRLIKSQPSTSDLPVMFLTARDQETDQISGIQLGADAYLTKPAGLALILAQLEALLRKFPRKPPGWLQAGKIHLNPNTRQLLVDGNPVTVTPTEFELLQLFMNQPKRIFDRSEILDRVFGNDKNVFDRTVDVHVKNLRLKLGPAGDLIRTVRGVGYGLNH